MGVLIHFNLATYIEVDGCSGQMVPSASLFNPYLLNTDNWVATMHDFGAVYAVLVAKVITIRISIILTSLQLSVITLACLRFSYGSN